jgi:hypothetical protein
MLNALFVLLGIYIVIILLLASLAFGYDGIGSKQFYFSIVNVFMCREIYIYST